MMDPAAVGRRVLETLEANRRRALAKRRARAAELEDLVLRAARLDRAAGKPARGRAARIVRRLELAGVVVSKRRVEQLLRNDRPALRHDDAAT